MSDHFHYCLTLYIYLFPSAFLLVSVVFMNFLEIHAHSGEQANMSCSDPSEQTTKTNAVTARPNGNEVYDDFIC